MAKKADVMPVVRYPGELGEPHVRSRNTKTSLLGFFGEQTPEVEQELMQKDAEALARKLDLLVDYYDARKDGKPDWYALSVSLAFAHVEGFQVVDWPKRKRGRPRTYQTHSDLYAAVIEVLEERNTSVINACRILSKRDGKWKKQNPGTLEARFHDAKRRIVAERSKSLYAPIYTSETTVRGYPKPATPGMLGGLFAAGMLEARRNKN